MILDGLPPRIMKSQKLGQKAILAGIIIGAGGRFFLHNDMRTLLLARV